jgi:hypothetical protein
MDAGVPRRPSETWIVWLGIGVILFMIGCGMYIQMPPATPDCVPGKPDQDGHQPTYEDRAAFARLLWWIGNVIHDHHDDIVALATVVVAFFTFTL